MSNARAARWCVLWLALLGLTHAWSSALVRPAFQVSDEMAYFADVQSAAGADPDSREPLSPGDRRLDAPLVRGGAKPLFGTVLAPVHRALRARLPAADALVMLRLLVALTVPLVVVCTFALARSLFPRNPLVVIGAPLLVAQQPVFVAYGAGITPDAAANLFAAIACVGLARLLRSASARDGVLVAGAAVVAFAFKDPAAGLAPGLVVCGGWAAWSRTRTASRPRRVAAAVLAVAGVAALLVLAWTGRLPMKTSYGERFAATALQRVAERGAGPWVTESLVPQLPSLTHSFWAHVGNFGVSTAWLPDAMFAAIGALLLLGATGVLLLFCARPPWLGAEAWPAARVFIVATAAMLASLVLLPQVRQLLLVEQVYDQGRWLFSALTPVAVLLVAGLSWPLPRPGRLAVASWSLLVHAMALTAMFGVLVPYHYEAFPWVLRPSSLYLLSGPVAPEMVQPYVLRPSWLLEGWAVRSVLGAWVALQAAGLVVLARGGWGHPEEDAR